MKQAILNWSTGKDAAYSLYLLQQSKEYEVVRLTTTVQQQFGRVSMHGIRRDLLLRQVHAVGLPVDVVELPNPLSTRDYELLMRAHCCKYRDEGILHHVFGDILLEDLKAFREQQLSQLGLIGVFPLWNKPTKPLLQEMIEAGFKAIVVCVNETFLDQTFLGRTIDDQFLNDLPEGVDPCGENGEFHTFVYDGPIFVKKLEFQIGEVVYKTYDAPKTNEGEAAKRFGFCFLDLL